MIQSKIDIANNLQKNYIDFMNKINSLDNTIFEMTPNGKWSAGMQLDHLIKSLKPLNQAFILPTFCFKLLFGKEKRGVFNYDKLFALYLNKIQNGAKATGAFIPPKIAFSSRTKLLENFKQENQKLINYLEKFSEPELDSVFLPHPLLGKITLREMYFFTIYHTEHHLKIVETI